jgi:predicted enzyme related to lactoylglutathione lyase
VHWLYFNEDRKGKLFLPGESLYCGMITKIAGLRTAIYKVPDINAAKQWYATAFETQPYFDEAFYVGFNIDGYELGLQPGDSGTGNKTGSVVAYWSAQDVAATYQRLVGVGATGNEPPQEVGGGIIVATVKDPWGNMIGLIFNPHFQQNGS